MKLEYYTPRLKIFCFFPIELKIDEKFYCNQEFDGDIGLSPMSTDKFAFITKTGNVVIRRMTNISKNVCSHIDELNIPSPEKVVDWGIETADSPDIYQNGMVFFFLLFTVS